MKYEWEADVALALQDIAECLPEGIDLIGVAVMNTESVEGAIVGTDYVFGSEISEADVTGDIFGDAETSYKAAGEKLHKFIKTKKATIQ